MSLSDFERCTPSEFSAIYKQWHEHDTMLYREGWEQVRTLVGFLLPLYNTKKTAADLLPFPWDPKKKNAAPKGSSNADAFRNLVKNRTTGG